MRSISQTITGSDQTPVLIGNLKQWLFMSSGQTHLDDRLSIALAAAIDAIEQSANLKICRRRILWKPEIFGYHPRRCDDREMILPFGNNTNAEIKYLDHDLNWQVFADTEWRIEENEGTNFSIVLEPESEWPDVTSADEWPIQIRFDCGWLTGQVWEAGTVYSVGDVVIPTIIRRIANGMVYTCKTGGTSGATEPTLTTEIGATTADGPDTLVWECTGQNVPMDIFAALCVFASDLTKNEALFLEYPNMNRLPYFDGVIANRELHW